MNKGSIISAAVAASMVIGISDFMDNDSKKEDNYRVEVKPKKEVVSINSEYLNDIVLEGEEESIKLEYEYEKYTICAGTKIYSDELKTDEITIDKMMVVSLLEVNGKSAKILFDNGACAFTNMSSLIKCIDINKDEFNMVEQNNMVLLNGMTKLYDDNGMYVKSVDTNTKCYVISVSNEYANVLFEDGSCGYVELSSLILMSAKIDGYAYVRNYCNTYSDKELSNIKGDIYAGSIIYVSFINDNYAYVIDNNGEGCYMNVDDLDKNYIMINLTDQRMYCFLDYKLAVSYGTRSGRDSSPTHTGDFDIDWKAENWEFTNFPGSHAKHWIPINEYGEGIHDLVGDDEANYGNGMYHTSGSHGCIRVPSSASQFVYDNYEIGDMVLVRKR